jgi:regulator of sigma E protease
MTWLVVVFGLALLVFLHELGHFMVARLVGMKPRAFYVGFPPALVKVVRNGIEYGIGALPLGGYVRIPGMHRPSASDFQTLMSPARAEDPGLGLSSNLVQRALEAEDFDGARAQLPTLNGALEQARLSPSARRSAERALRDVDEGCGADAYWRQPIWKRIAVIGAGPGMNVLVAFVIFFAVYLSGAPSSTPSTRVAQVDANTPARMKRKHFTGSRSPSRRRPRLFAAPPAPRAGSDSHDAAGAAPRAPPTSVRRARQRRSPPA